MSGFGDLGKELRGLSDGLSKLNGLSVSIDTDDSVSVVVGKLKQEIRRQRAYMPSDSELRGMAQDMLREARR